MGSLLLIGALLAGGAGLAVFAHWATRQSARERQDRNALLAAKAFHGLGEGPGVHQQQIDGFDVRVETTRVQATAYSAGLLTHAVVGGRGRIPPELELKAEPPLLGMRKALGGDDLQLGDEDFDRAVSVRGPEDAALAALNAEARRLVAAFVAQGGEVGAGALHLRWGEARSPEALQQTLRTMVMIARTLVVDALPACLLANATKDPNPRVRRRNLAALAERHAGEPEARAGLAAGLLDADPEVRLLAIRHSPSDPAARAALERLVAGAQQSSEGVGVALAQALAAVGGASAEDGLLALLGHGSGKVRREAALGLGAIGTVRAVERLLALAEGEEKQAARDAVRAIQARLGGAEGGRVSVVASAAEEGGLSLGSGPADRERQPR